MENSNTEKSNTEKEVVIVYRCYNYEPMKKWREKNKELVRERAREYYRKYREDPEKLERMKELNKLRVRKHYEKKRLEQKNKK